MLKPFTFILLFISFFSFGKKHWAGFYAGYNLNMAWGENDTGGSMFGHSFSLGGTYQFDIKDWLYTETGLGYDQIIVHAVSGRLCTETGSDFLYPGGSENVKYGLNYITIPLKIGFKSKRKTYVFFTIGAAPSFLFLATAKGEFRLDDPNEDNLTFASSNISKGSTKFNIPASLELGLGGHLKGGQRMYGSLSFNLQLMQQTLPREIHGYFVSRGQHRWRNVWIQAKIGVNFNLPKK